SMPPMPQFRLEKSESAGLDVLCRCALAMSFWDVLCLICFGDVLCLMCFGDMFLRFVFAICFLKGHGFSRAATGSLIIGALAPRSRSQRGFMIRRIYIAILLTGLALSISGCRHNHAQNL